MLNTTNKRTLKKFGIISSILFSIIVISSMIWVYMSNHDVAVTSSSINIIILSCGTIGLSYCFLILKGLDKKIDKDIFNDYDKLVREYKQEEKNSNNNGA